MPTPTTPAAVIPQEPWKPCTGVQTNDAGHRSKEAYDATIDQFDVEKQPRYQTRNGATFCNVFANDVMTAMGAPLMRPEGMLVNELIKQMMQGQVKGWIACESPAAWRYALAGRPSVMLWRNPGGGHGHIAVVRPSLDPELLFAQAGRTNKTRCRFHEAFPANCIPVQAFFHD